jgi:fermentation-respiration switch protein FrsA (DUF1100 family)
MNTALDLARRGEKLAGELRIPLWVFGSSLGTFSALHVFAEGYGQKVVLHAPLTTMVEVAADLYPYLPVQFFLGEAYRFDSESRLSAVRARLDSEQDTGVLVVHGDEDMIVAQRFGKRIAETLDCPFVDAVGRRHNDVSLQRSGEFGQQIQEFLL